MNNRLLTLEEAAARMLENLQKLSPAQQALAVYSMQTGMGGFPRDLNQEALMLEAIELEKT